MEGAWRRFAAGALVLAALGAGAALILSEKSEPAPVPRPETVTKTVTEQLRAERAPRPERPAPERRPPEFELSKEGSPIVWVRSGERARIHASPGGEVVETVGDETEFGSRTIFAVFERRGEWAGVPNQFTGNGSLGWVKLENRTLSAGHTLREIVIDLSEFRGQLLIDGRPVRTFTVAIGAPGTTTPTGRFAVTDTFRGDLNPAYGCCAVALSAEQPNLPSGWLGGNRIAIHGTSGPLGEPISSGCVRAADRDVNALVDEVPPGAPVLIRQ
jgi:L,D-transpeptidase catalytic domain